MTANEMAEKVQDYMDGMGWKYGFKFDEERPQISAGVNLDCKLQSLQLRFLFSRDGYCVLGTIRLNADEETRPLVMEYLTRANYGLRNGNFELDLRDGEVRYKLFVPGRHLDDLPGDLIKDSIMLPPTMVDRYGNGLLAIMMGVTTDVEGEINKAEGN